VEPEYSGSFGFTMVGARGLEPVAGLILQKKQNCQLWEFAKKKCGELQGG
jgi:hypothetical protein